MSQSPSGLPSADDLQFTTVEPAVAAGATAVPSGAQICVGCHRPIESAYFAIAGKVLCPKCTAQVQAPLAGSGAVRLARAAILGLIAGLAGAVIWFVLRRFVHLQSGLVAILVGFMVGKAVRKGSGGRGGRAYQVLAVVLTYCCIAANYMPDVLEWMAKSAPHPAGAESIGAIAGHIVFAFGFSLGVPFLRGVQGALGLLIIGFALWEAWKLSAGRKLPITGPYYIAQPQGVPGAIAAVASADSEVII